MNPPFPHSPRTRILQAALGFCAFSFLAITCALSLPTFYRVIRDEFSKETFERAPDLKQLLPAAAQSPRLSRLEELSRQYPSGSIGIDYETYEQLSALDWLAGNELAYMGFERIVQETGQPVRFDGAVPETVTYLLLFQESAPEGIAPVSVFEDMGLYPVRARP